MGWMQILESAPDHFDQLLEENEELRKRVGTKKRKKKPLTDDNLNQEIINELKWLWLTKWPARKEALARQRVGTSGYYYCESCGAINEKKKVHVDHIIPVIPLEGFDSLDGVRTRLFCGLDGLQVLCVLCHGIKSKKENETRRALLVKIDSSSKRIEGSR